MLRITGCKAFLSFELIKTFASESLFKLKVRITFLYVIIIKPI